MLYKEFDWTMVSITGFDWLWKNAHQASKIWVHMTCSSSSSTIIVLYLHMFVLHNINTNNYSLSPMRLVITNFSLLIFSCLFICCLFTYFQANSLQNINNIFFERLEFQTYFHSSSDMLVYLDYLWITIDGISWHT